MPNAPKVSKSGDSAYYSVTEDRVNMPQLKKFMSLDAYYSTFFHELVHSTRHSTRLNRTYRNEQSNKPRVFGSCDYSREELVAEIGAAFLCAEAGVENLAQNVSYIEGWLSAIADDERLIVHAAAHAQRAADYILAIPPSNTPNTRVKTQDDKEKQGKTRKTISA